MVISFFDQFSAWTMYMRKHLSMTFIILCELHARHLNLRQCTKKYMRCNTHIDRVFQCMHAAQKNLFKGTSVVSQKKTVAQKCGTFFSSPSIYRVLLVQFFFFSRFSACMTTFHDVHKVWLTWNSSNSTIKTGRDAYFINMQNYFNCFLYIELDVDSQLTVKVSENTVKKASNCITQST